MKVRGSVRRRKDARDSTREVTGQDANMDEAEVGSAGNGADAYGADFTGGPPTPLESEPSEQDIRPDRIERFPGAEEEEVDDDAITARPDEAPPVDTSELP